MLLRRLADGAALVRPAMLPIGQVLTLLAPLVPALVIAGLAFAMLYPVWLQGRIYVEPDTVNYYYPALRAWQEWLRRGDLLVWTPHTLSGFPLFAEGEVGMLYPPHALLLLALPFDLAFPLVPILHLAIAAFGAYLLATWLTGGSRPAGLIGGTAYGFGGLMIAQIHHTDVHSGFAWLPWIFWSFERARAAGLRPTSPWPAAMALFLALQLLTVHPQVPLTTLFGLSIYAAIRSLTDRTGLLARLGGVVRAAIAILAVTLGAIGLAAAQLIPLAEVGLHSQRTNGWDYARATEYSQSFWNLITAVFPLFYYDRLSLDWGHWVRWEAPLYVGVPTLALAVVGLFAGRSRARFAFLVMAIVALWISFADYSPLNLHWLLYQLPGFSVFRAPGRFAVLWDLSAAMLAAQGAAFAASWLRSRRWGAAGVLGLWTAFALAVPAGMAFLWLRLSADRDGAVALLRQTILAVRRSDTSISAERILSNLLDVLAFWTNARSATGVALLIATTLILWLWWWRPRVQVWSWALAALLAGDLLVLGTRYHGTAPIAELPAQSETARYVIANRGLHRVLSSGDPNTRALRLLPFETAVVGGDSSLQSATDAQFAVSVAQLDNGLLDLWNVRYVVQRKGRYGPADVNFPGPAWYERTLIDPDRPLARLVAGTPEETVSFRLPAGFNPAELRIVSNLRFGSHVGQGDAVATITFEPAVTAVEPGPTTATSAEQPEGGAAANDPDEPAVELAASAEAADEPAVNEADGSAEAVKPADALELQAGTHTAEWAAARPDVAATLRHALPPVAFRYPNDPEQRAIYYGALSLPDALDAQTMTIRAVDPAARLFIHGLALVASDGRTWQLGRFDKARYQLVAADRESLVYENLTVLPRAYLVPTAVSATDEFDALERMREPSFDPRAAAVVEGIAPRLPGSPMTSADSVVVHEYTATSARYLVAATADRLLVVTDTMFPGWAATIDGVPARIWLADAQYRAVRVPAGVHVVELRYQPASVAAGFLVSGLFLAALIGYTAAALRFAARRARRVPKLIDRPASL